MGGIDFIGCGLVLSITSTIIISAFVFSLCSWS